MDCNTFAQLTAFRQQLYACFSRAGDALFNCIDALLSETPARSFAELSLSPFFVRQWPSLYQALQEASVDRVALQRLFCAYVRLPGAGERLLLGIDASSIARPCSATAADRTYVHQSNLPEGSKPVRPGWQFSTLTVLPQSPCSWTYVLDNVRVASAQTQGEAAAAQITSVLPLLPTRALLLGDGYYGSVTFLTLLKDAPCDALLRFARNRVLFRPAPPKTGKRGAPKKDGERFACHDQQTHGTPDASWQGHNDLGHPLEVSAWRHLHFQSARDIVVSVIRIVRPSAANTKRDPRVSWLVWRGQTLPPLEQIEGLYRRRYSQEHGYRVDKQNLLWETPRLRTPTQFQTWTDLVACARNLLCLARPLAQAARQPWESARRQITPQQTRRAMPTILTHLGTPARAPQVRGKSPGRAVGAIIKKATTYKVIYKAKNKTKDDNKDDNNTNKMIVKV